MDTLLCVANCQQLFTDIDYVIRKNNYTVEKYTIKYDDYNRQRYRWFIGTVSHILLINSSPDINTEY